MVGQRNTVVTITLSSVKKRHKSHKSRLIKFKPCVTLKGSTWIDSHFATSSPPDYLVVHDSSSVHSPVRQCVESPLPTICKREKLPQCWQIKQRYYLQIAKIPALLLKCSRFPHTANDREGRTTLFEACTVVEHPMVCCLATSPLTFHDV